MFGNTVPSAQHLAGVLQVADWARGRFSLPPEATVLVSELECALPGCPPLETVIAFWTGPPERPQRHQHKVFKPLLQVQQDDLPPYWMKDALAVAADFASDCC